MRAKPPGEITLATVLLAIFRERFLRRLIRWNGAKRHTLGTSGHDDIFGSAEDDALYGEGWTETITTAMPATTRSTPTRTIREVP